MSGVSKTTAITVLFIALFGLCMIFASQPAYSVRRIAVNNETGQCGQYSEGDFFNSYVLYPDWSVIYPQEEVESYTLIELGNGSKSCKMKPDGYLEDRVRDCCSQLGYKYTKQNGSEKVLVDRMMNATVCYPVTYVGENDRSYIYDYETRYLDPEVCRKTEKIQFPYKAVCGYGFAGIKINEDTGQCSEFFKGHVRAQGEVLPDVYHTVYINKSGMYGTDAECASENDSWKIYTNIQEKSSSRSKVGECAYPKTMSAEECCRHLGYSFVQGNVGIWQFPSGLILVLAIGGGALILVASFIFYILRKRT